MRFSRLLLLVFALTAPLLAWQQGHGGEGDMGEQLKSLLRVTDPSTGFILVALGVSFLAGAAHALTPGHGKALVAAYLVGSGGTVRDAVFPRYDRDDHAHRGSVRSRRGDHLRYSALFDGNDLRLVIGRKRSADRRDWRMVAKQSLESLSESQCGARPWAFPRPIRRAYPRPFPQPLSFP